MRVWCDDCRAVKLAFELGRERNASIVAHDRRSKLSKTRVEVEEKTREFNHWATEADKHIGHKVSMSMSMSMSIVCNERNSASVDFKAPHNRLSRRDAPRSAVQSTCDNLFCG